MVIDNNWNDEMNYFDTPSMTEAGYIFVKYLNKSKTEALFDAGDGLEVWSVNDNTNSYGFWFSDHLWEYDGEFIE